MRGVRPGRSRSRIAAVALAGATILSLSGCWWVQEDFDSLDSLDSPVFGLRISPTYCTGLWHMPNTNFAGSLSWGLYATLIETDDGSDLPELGDARISVDGLPGARASIDASGVLVGVLPLTEFGSYPITGLVVILPDGTEYPFTLSYDFEVGANASDIACEGDEADAKAIRGGILTSPLVDF